MLIQPLITEQSLAAANRGWYTFKTNRRADKVEIAQAIARYYKVDVKAVRTISMHGKVRRVGRARKMMRQSDWKKALVSLAPGQKIDAFEANSQKT